MSMPIAAKETLVKADSLTIDVVNPDGYQVDDVIFVSVSKDDGAGGALTFAGTGWQTLGNGLAGTTGNNSCRLGVYYIIVTSGNVGSLPELQVISTDADTWTAVAWIERGCNLASLVDAQSSFTAVLTGNPYTAPSVTTTTANARVFYCIACDGSFAPLPPPGLPLIFTARDGGSGCCVASAVQEVAGATPTCPFLVAGTGDESVVFTFAINDGSSGTILPGYPNTDCASVIRPLNGANLPYTGDALDANSDSFTQLAGTWIDPDVVYQVTAGGVFTDITAAATSATIADVTPIAAGAINAYIAIGYSDDFRALRVDNSGCTQGVGGNCNEQYLSAAGTWKAMPDFFDNFSNLTGAIGNHRIYGWTRPKDWVPMPLNGVTKKWYRFQAYATYTTVPTWSRVFISTNISLHHDTLTGRTAAGATPWVDSINVTPPQGGNLMCGGAYTLASAMDLSTACLLGTFLLDSPADKLDMSNRVDGGGLAIGLIDSTNKVKAWAVAGRDQLDTYDQKRGIYTIQVNQSVDTALLSNTPTMTGVKKLLFMAGNKFGAVQVSLNPLLNMGTLKIHGGGSAAPVDFAELIAVANSYPCPMIDSITNVAYCRILIGGGKRVHMVIDGGSLTWPKHASVANKESSRHVDPGALGFHIDPRATDTFRWTNGTWQSGAADPWEVLATASASSDCLLTGNVIGMAVKLRPICPWAGLKFVSCPTWEQTLSAVDACTFIDTTATVDDPDLLTNCNFTSGGTGHAMRITATGTRNLNSIFSGYGADGTTDAAIFNDSGGALTLVVPVGIALPTVRNGAGASTTLMLPNFNLTVSNLTASYVAIDNASDVQQTYDALVTGSKVLSVPYSETGNTWHVHVRRKGYAPRKISITFDGNNVTVDGSLVQRLNFSGTATYTGTTSADCLISLNDPATDEARIDLQASVTAQIIYNMFEDAIVGASAISSPLDATFFQDPVGFQLLSMSSNLKLRRWHVGDTLAEAVGMFSQADNQPLDLSNGGVQFTGTPVLLTQQDVTDAAHREPSVGVVTAAGSVADALVGLKIVADAINDRLPDDPADHSILESTLDGIDATTQGIQGTVDAVAKMAESDKVFVPGTPGTGVLHYYERGTTTDLIPPKDVAGVSQTQAASLTE